MPPVLCDQARTLQILNNLLSNANKYTPSKGIITIDVEPKVAENFLQLTVADTGLGISAKDQEQLSA